MPKIPDFQYNPGMINERVPSADISASQVGYTGAAIEHLGDAALKVTDNLMAKRKAASDADFTYKTSTSDMNDFSKFDEDLKKTMPADFSGYTDQVNQFWQNRIDKNIQNAPSPEAQSAYQQHATLFATQSLVTARATEGVARASAYQDNFKSGVETVANQIVQNPDPKSAQVMSQQLKAWNQAGAGSIIGNEQSARNDEAIDKAVSNALIQGMYNKAKTPADYKGILNLLNQDLSSSDKSGFRTSLRNQQIDAAVDSGLTSPEAAAALKAKPVPPEAGPPAAPTAVTKGLTASERYQWLLKVQSETAQTASVNMRLLSSNLADHEAYLRATGSNVDPAYVAKLQSLPKQGLMDQGESAKKIDSLFTAQAEGKVRQQMAMATPDQMSNLINQITQVTPATKNVSGANSRNDFNFADKEGAMGRLTLAKNTMLRERNADPAAYIRNNSPDAADAFKQIATGDPASTSTSVNKLLSIQDHLGVPKDQQRILPKGDTTALATQLQVMDPMTASKKFTDLQTQYGDKFPLLLNQMIKDNPSLEPYRTIGITPDPDDRMRMIANLRNEKINPDFKLQYPDKVKDVGTQVQSQLSDFNVALARSSLDGGNSARIAAIHDNVETYAKSLIIQSGGKLSAEDAAKQAQGIIGRAYNTTQAGNSIVNAPKQINGVTINPDIVKGFMASHMDEQFLNQANAFIPNGPEWAGATSEDKEKAFYDTFQKTGYWADKADGTGIRLMYQNPKRGPDFVYDQRGKPIEYKYTDISQKPDAKTIEQMNSVTTKVKGLFGK